MSLPEPSFIDRDPVAITAELKASWEVTTGKTLYPGQVESLLLDLLAYRETLIRIGIQEAAKQNLVAYANAPMLDYLGELVGVYRIDDETDDQLRERIKLAPEAFTTAGSRGSYIYHAKSASADIVDVSVISPSPGIVNIYPLSVDGLPGQSLLDAVYTTCNAEDVRPLTDYVQVLQPVATDYSIAVTIETYQWPDQALVQRQVQDALAALAMPSSGMLGKDITTSSIVAAATVSGVYRVTVTSPVADVIIPPEGYANCSGITVTMGVPVNG